MYFGGTHHTSGLSHLLDTTFKTGDEEILQLFNQLVGRWVLVLRESLDNLDDDQVRDYHILEGCLTLKYLRYSVLLP